LGKADNQQRALLDLESREQWVLVAVGVAVGVAEEEAQMPL